MAPLCRFNLVAAVLVASPVLAFCSCEGRCLRVTNRPATSAGFSSHEAFCAVLGPLGEERRQQSSLCRRDDGRSFSRRRTPDALDAARRFAVDRGILGSRVFVEPAPLCSIHLANNLVDLLFTSGDAQTPEAEILRVLRPGGVAHVGNRQVVKPMPEGTDAWSHPYHAPDNNTLSTDQLARAPYLTQFMAEPMFSPMPEVTVAAGGRVFKACGHIAHRRTRTSSSTRCWPQRIQRHDPLDAAACRRLQLSRHPADCPAEVLYWPPPCVPGDRRGARKTPTTSSWTIRRPTAGWRGWPVSMGSFPPSSAPRRWRSPPRPRPRRARPWPGAGGRGPLRQSGAPLRFRPAILALDPKSKRFSGPTRGLCRTTAAASAWPMAQFRVLPEQFLICVSAATWQHALQKRQATCSRDRAPGPAQHYFRARAPPPHQVQRQPACFRRPAAAAARRRLGGRRQALGRKTGPRPIVRAPTPAPRPAPRMPTPRFTFSYAGEFCAPLPRPAPAPARPARSPIFFRAAAARSR